MTRNATSIGRGCGSLPANGVASDPGVRGLERRRPCARVGGARRTRRQRVARTRRFAKGSGKTVIATLPGANPVPYYIVARTVIPTPVGRAPDDNASGVATVMEIARAYARGFALGAIRDPSLFDQVHRLGRGVSIRADLHRARRGTAETARAASSTSMRPAPGPSAMRSISSPTTCRGTRRSCARSRPSPPTTLDSRGSGPSTSTNPSQGGTDFIRVPPPKGTIPGPGYTTADSFDYDLHRGVGQARGTGSDARLGVEGHTGSEEAEDRLLPSTTTRRRTRLENTTEREPQNMVRAVKVTGLAL